MKVKEILDLLHQPTNFEIFFKNDVPIPEDRTPHSDVMEAEVRLIGIGEYMPGGMKYIAICTNLEDHQ